MSEFEGEIAQLIQQLKTSGVKVDAGRWQGVPTEGKPDLVTKEILNATLCAQIPQSAHEAADQIQPNLPWAEDHFEERVSRIPSNPGEQYKNWPWWHETKEGTTQAAGPWEYTEADRISPPFKFTHTYQERFWPKHTQADWGSTKTQIWPKMKGIRYDYGDLDDVVGLLRREPHTRQAYLPIFFPEDTGAVHGGRIPCTLGYHFMLRGDRLHCWYAIRSCDAVRHFRDDLYLAARLVQWVIAELVEYELRNGVPQLWVDVDPGRLFFTAYSFHVHMGDYHLL